VGMPILRRGGGGEKRKKPSPPPGGDVPLNGKRCYLPLTYQTLSWRSIDSLTSKTLKERPAMRTKPVSTLLFVLLLLGSSSALLADGFPEDCAGTFLTQEGSGAKSIWTFGQDGTFLGTSSTQRVFNFSNQ